MKKNFLVVSLSVLISLGSSAQTDFAGFVNPFIGTGGHGHTYPGATVPHGMVQLSPDTRLTGWDGCSGYHYDDDFIFGFSHTHLSGTGVPDYCDILFMPGTGEPSFNNKIYGSRFSHTRESASAGYYSVHLDDDDIEVELTATERVGFHHYRFNHPDNNYVIIDLLHRDEVLESTLSIDDSVTVSGMRRSRGWADNQYVYFVAKFSKPIQSSGLWKNNVLYRDSIYFDGKNLKGFFRFDLKEQNDLFVKVAISPVSIDGAKKNLNDELPYWDFDEIKNKAKEKWNQELGKIDVKSSDTTKLRIFYTALYHTAVVPNINMDVDGAYRGRDNKIHNANGFTYYSVFSLWDTYRAAHPLYTIIDVPRSIDYIKTFLTEYQQGGRLPVWDLAGCETDCMIGYHSIPVIWDAYSKGINDFDTSLALEAMKKSATWNHLGLPAYIRKHLIEVSDEAESVSKTLEYAYDDWCIAMYARKMGLESDHREYIKRAQYYKNMLNLKTGFMQPRDNGGWQPGFDPSEVNNNFTEANSWQYSFYFPQDIGGYMRMRGGPKTLERKLDDLFTASSITTGREQSDITGLIGQYAHGNEPSHHIIHLYDHAGKASKAQYYLHKVMMDFYKDAPDGLIGNEDCGQMSAWYVLNAMGFYPVTPGDKRYFIGAPVFPLVEINLPEGRTFVINAPYVSDSNHFVQSALLSTTASLMPKPMSVPYFTHHDLAGGGLITLMMGSKPTTFFDKPVAEPSILSDPNTSELVLNPVIDGGSRSFREKNTLKIYAPQKGAIIYYTTDSTAPTRRSRKYINPFVITKSTFIRSKAYNLRGDSSAESIASYVAVKNNWKITYQAQYEPQYAAGGTTALTDGLYGSTDWRKGYWQGFQKDNAIFTMDLGKIQNVNLVSIGFLQDVRSWIVAPKMLRILTSVDGKNFNEVYEARDFLSIEDPDAQVLRLQIKIPDVRMRYLKVEAQQYGKMPHWHEGAGGDTHIFVDEIEIK